MKISLYTDKTSAGWWIGCQMVEMVPSPIEVKKYKIKN